MNLERWSSDLFDDDDVGGIGGIGVARKKCDCDAVVSVVFSVWYGAWWLIEMRSGEEEKKDRGGAVIINTSDKGMENCPRKGNA